jgi:hypothetical protein
MKRSRIQGLVGGVVFLEIYGVGFLRQIGSSVKRLRRNQSPKPRQRGGETIVAIALQRRNPVGKVSTIARHDYGLTDRARHRRMIAPGAGIGRGAGGGAQ